MSPYYNNMLKNYDLTCKASGPLALLQ